MRASQLADQAPVSKCPAKGNAGWTVQLSAAGELTFAIGSQASNTPVVVPNAYRVGQEVHVACVFSGGRATIYLDGKQAAAVDNITQTTDDRTAPGSIGYAWGRSKLAYTGELGDVRVYNRALTESDIQSLLRKP
jgi:hypothetical protein